MMLEAEQALCGLQMGEYRSLLAAAMRLDEEKRALRERGVLRPSAGPLIRRAISDTPQAARLLGVHWG